MTTWSRGRRVHAAIIVMLLAAGAIALASLTPERRPGAPARAVGTPAASAPAPSARSPRALPAPPAPPARGSRGLVATDESGPARVAAPPRASSGSFAARYPDQANATRTEGVPASNHWALLVGINDYAGSTRDNVGSYEDARDLRAHLLSLGWMPDHIALVANRDATASRIVEAIRWLASKTDDDSVVVFHYAGHEKPLRTSSDGDAEGRDVAIWAADNRLVLDGVLGRELGRVRAERMWIDLAVCRAGGFSDAGMTGPGRVLTFSSPETELSYEDPQVRNSVFGWYLIEEGMRQGLADADGNGVVTAEEAFTYARPFVTDRTGGKQHPAMIDGLGGGFDLRPPAPPPPPPPPDDGGGSSCGVLVLCSEPRRAR